MWSFLAIYCIAAIRLAGFSTFAENELLSAANFYVRGDPINLLDAGHVQKDRSIDLHDASHVQKGWSSSKEGGGAFELCN